MLRKLSLSKNGSFKYRFAQSKLSNIIDKLYLLETVVGPSELNLCTLTTIIDPVDLYLPSLLR